MPKPPNARQSLREMPSRGSKMRSSRWDGWVAVGVQAEPVQVS